MRVLAGDIGGTKTDLRLYSGPSRSELSVERRARFDSQSFSGLTPILGEFLRGERVDAAGFGVAGPVINGVCHTTNLPWIVTQAELQKVCATPYCALLNDVQAAALGVSLVGEERKVWLQKAPVDPTAPVELVSLGTGFGRSFVIPGVGAFATESGRFEPEVAKALVDRVAMWPGQLTAYDTGALEFFSLRKQAQETLGSRFDIREFHSILLENGTVTLPMLREQVAHWLKSKTND